MKKRILTAIVCLPLLILFVSLGGIWLRGILMLLSWIGLYELFRAVSGKVLAVHFAAYGFTGVYYMQLLPLGTVVPAFILACIVLLVVFYKETGVRDCFVTIGGFFYVSFLLSFVYLVRAEHVYWVWLIFISSSVCDVFAYFTGRFFGKHKLTGTPSPGKTVEGCIGGVFGAAVVGFIYGSFFEMAVFMMAVSVMGAVFSQFGDLFASAIKRSVEIKDFGNLLPGHGGVLDRFDSIIVAAPMVYLLI